MPRRPLLLICLAAKYLINASNVDDTVLRYRVAQSVLLQSTTKESLLHHRCLHAPEQHINIPPEKVRSAAQQLSLIEVWDSIFCIVEVSMSPVES